MRNPAREDCYNSSCNSKSISWTSHLPCTHNDFQSSIPSKNAFPTSDVSLLKIKSFPYTPQIKSYFKQPSYTKPSLKARTIRPTFTFKELIEWGIGNELYL